ncbi:uncharacterized protein MONOS_18040 [Monocercomonoides exilis]|uniref:uncharacterized protein n=1 Tax=Monocercomonoides exilis TaxID=2049356 RepID=UPI00355A7906|nr:hypothetical protein MONOS_18040 [Monocercomonoides exilis]
MREAEMNIEGEEEAVTTALSAVRVASGRSSRRLDYAAEGQRGCVENKMMEGVVMKDSMDREMEIEMIQEVKREGIESTADEEKGAESGFEGKVITIGVSG